MDQTIQIPGIQYQGQRKLGVPHRNRPSSARPSTFSQTFLRMDLHKDCI